MRNLADGTKDQHPISLLQIIIDSIGLCSSYTAMLIIGRQIKRLEDGEVKQLKEARGTTGRGTKGRGSSTIDI